MLITGFEPFGGETVNPSWEAVVRLPDTVGSYRLCKQCIPTVFGRAAEAVLTAAESLTPDVILCIGQAGGRAAITPEVVAINRQDATIPDNAGNMPQDTAVIAKEREAYFSTIPARRITEAIQSKGIPSQLSYSAGVFVCNDLLYRLLHYYHGTETQVGFLHVPYLPEQAGTSIPNLPIDTIVKALTVAIEAL
ncbi:MAG: pyroglutamyl-peptidase I [Ruminococcaceae bacterium]|nr:pyroglutamyl-peptidase I [Oscillospiraceae bacterium]